MQQAIVGFHIDEENHWVADLACGHTQHVRHDPPWQNRPWVLTEQGRKEKLGVMFECKSVMNWDLCNGDYVKCRDMNHIKFYNKYFSYSELITAKLYHYFKTNFV